MFIWKKKSSVSRSILTEGYTMYFLQIVSGLLVTLRQFVLVCGVGEEGNDLWVSKLLLLFTIGVRSSNDSQNYAFWQN